MLDRRPPFGTLRSVVPVIQSHSHGSWRLTLISVEDWDNCCAETTELVSDPLPPAHADLHPFVTLDAVADGGQHYVSGFGGAFGGGRINGGQEHRMLVRFAPTFDLDAESVGIEGRLRLSHPGQTPSGLKSPAWEDPEPWVFVISRPDADKDSPVEHPVLPPQGEQPPPHPSCSPDLGELNRVVPVVAERIPFGWEIAVPLRAAGFPDPADTGLMD